ncbi:hypothetical protein BHM03_00039689 [Ensete ventricosum]|nr:hypothetical protein BHM03_00039689 [Ensete ventricosum]
MLRPGVTQEWVGEGELPRERTKYRRWRRPYEVLPEATHREVRRVFRVCASKLASDESLGYQHMGAVYHRGRSQIASTSESHGGGLDYTKSEDKAEGRTSMKSSIPCSHGGRALVVKGAEEVENAKANSRYQDMAEGHRLRNFIRPVSMSFS